MKIFWFTGLREFAEALATAFTLADFVERQTETTVKLLHLLHVKIVGTVENTHYVSFDRSRPSRKRQSPNVFQWQDFFF